MGTREPHMNIQMQHYKGKKTGKKNIGNIYFNICSKFLFFKGLKKHELFFEKTLLIHIMFTYKTNNKE